MLPPPVERFRSSNVQHRRWMCPTPSATARLCVKTKRKARSQASISTVRFYCSSQIGGTVTERGCISSNTDLASCAVDGHDCATCNIENEGAGCNSALFPSDRRRCTIGTTANAYCPNPWDDCVQLLQSGTRKRTCRSSLTAAESTFCASNSNLCQFCSTDNCNAAEVNFNYVECL